MARISHRTGIIVLAGSFLASAAACLVLAYLQEPKFEKIHEGMTRDEVEACLGRPHEEFNYPWVHPTRERRCGLIYEDGFWQKRHARFIVDIDQNADTVTRTYVVDGGPDDRGLIERIGERLRRWARMWF